MKILNERSSHYLEKELLLKGAFPIDFDIMRLQGTNEQRLKVLLEIEKAFNENT